MSDDSEAVIVEVFEAISAALKQLHFAVKALCDAVIFGRAPHAGDRLNPAGESIGQVYEWCKVAFLEALDGLRQTLR